MKKKWKRGTEFRRITRKIIAYEFLQGTGVIRTGKIKEDLANQFPLSVNSYPCDLENATNMFINYNNYVNNKNRPGKKKKQPKKDLYK